ncbi:MAG TPA: polyprenyl diphosphate synthase [Steroidobacteraceae bacterium]
MHVAIIMDGNGRWATERRMPRTAGHRAGAKTVDTIVEAAVRQGVDTLTLYAFSAANWSRPAGEVSALFTLLRRYLLTQTRRCVEQSIRINVIGRRDRLQPELLRVIEQSEQATQCGSRMTLRIAIDYSAQRSLLAAAKRLNADDLEDESTFRAHLGAVDHCQVPVADVDLLIRTGGEKRLSDFLLWECAYAELYFVERQWPEFSEQDFIKALGDFSRRERRFGQVLAPLKRMGSG